MQANIISCLSQGRINRESCNRKGIRCNNGGMMEVSGGTDSPDGVPSRQNVGASASVIFPCFIKSRRWQSTVEEADKGCSEFCVTVGTVTILVHSRLKALAVNLSWPSSLIGSNKLTTLAGSKQTLFFVQILLLLSHVSEWVNVPSATGSPR